MIRLAIMLSTALLSNGTAAQSDAGANSAPGVCPDPKPLKNMCMIVGQRMKDSSGRNDYLYITRMHDAACVDERNDTDAQQDAKLQKMWLAYRDTLVCNSVQFDVMRGNILKFAVSSKADPFLDQVIDWKLDLNAIDPSDERTVLDYVEYHRKRNEGNSLESMFQRYYNALRKAGARHARELH